MPYPIFTINLDELAGDPARPNKRSDMATALAIIIRHQTESGGPLRLLEGWRESEDGTFWVELPSWLIELNQVFYDRYGDEAEAALRRVIQELLPLESVH
jgi:hypothetical protein